MRSIVVVNGQVQSYLIVIFGRNNWYLVKSWWLMTTIKEPCPKSLDESVFSFNICSSLYCFIWFVLNFLFHLFVVLFCIIFYFVLSCFSICFFFINFQCNWFVDWCFYSDVEHCNHSIIISFHFWSAKQCNYTLLHWI